MNNLSELGLSTLFRCDGNFKHSQYSGPCAAQAFTAAVKGELLLLFCGSCTSRHREALEAQGWTIIDRTDRINLEASQSANV